MRSTADFLNYKLHFMKEAPGGSQPCSDFIWQVLSDNPTEQLEEAFSCGWMITVYFLFSSQEQSQNYCYDSRDVAIWSSKTC